MFCVCGIGMRCKIRYNKFLSKSQRRLKDGVAGCGLKQGLPAAVVGGQMLFDSHCHFTDEGFDGQREELAERIRGSELKFIADIGTDLRTSRAAAEAAAHWEVCYAVAGWHPAEVGRLDEELLAQTMELLKLPKVVAIGEIGLDYHWEDNPHRGLQQRWFRRQLQEAARLGAPVCVHTRDADGDTFDILKELALGKTKVLMHCYSGSAELARQYVKLGAKISIAGPVTYKNARKTVETVQAVDLSDLLIETDSPYLAPVPLRGQQNTPPYVEYVARKIAEIKDISYEEVAEATFRNACEFYGIDI